MAKKFIIALAVLGIPLAAWATCTSTLVFVNGKAVPCTTCCNDSGCYTQCYPH